MVQPGDGEAVTLPWPELAAQLAAAFDWRLGVAAFATAVAGIMRGFAGFGTAIILAPVYSVLWGPAVGVPAMLLLEAAIGSQLLIQAEGVIITIVWSAVVAAIAYKIADLVFGLRVPEDEEREGLDTTAHGERAYT